MKSTLVRPSDFSRPRLNIDTLPKAVIIALRNALLNLTHAPNLNSSPQIPHNTALEAAEKNKGKKIEQKRRSFLRDPGSRTQARCRRTHYDLTRSGIPFANEFTKFAIPTAAYRNDYPTHPPPLLFAMAKPAMWLTTFTSYSTAVSEQSCRHIATDALQ